MLQEEDRPEAEAKGVFLMMTLKSNGDFSKVTNWLERMKESAHIGILDKYGKRGVDALRDATPKDTGKTADSWDYEITNENGRATITFTNSNIQNGIPIAVILQYGHATNGGGWVQGIDYINPAIRPVFDEIVNEAWKEVTR